MHEEIDSKTKHSCVQMQGLHTLDLQPCKRELAASLEIALALSLAARVFCFPRYERFDVLLTARVETVFLGWVRSFRSI